MILALEADINSLYGKSLLGLRQMDEAITRHRLEFQVAKRIIFCWKPASWFMGFPSALRGFTVPSTAVRYTVSAPCSTLRSAVSGAPSQGPSTVLARAGIHCQVCHLPLCYFPQARLMICRRPAARHCHWRWLKQPQLLEAR